MGLFAQPCLIHPLQQPRKTDGQARGHPPNMTGEELKLRARPVCDLTARCWQSWHQTPVVCRRSVELQPPWVPPTPPSHAFLLLFSCPSHCLAAIMGWPSAQWGGRRHRHLKVEVETVPCSVYLSKGLVFTEHPAFSSEREEKLKVRCI